MSWRGRGDGVGRCALLHEGEQAEHADVIEPLDLAIGLARRHPGLAGALGRRLAGEHAGAHHLVGALLRPLDQERELLPIVRRLDARALSGRHRPHLGAARTVAV